MFNPQSAKDAGFLDQVVPAEELMSTARAAAQQLKTINLTAHAKTKLKVRKELLAELGLAIELDKTAGLS